MGCISAHRPMDIVTRIEYYYLRYRTCVYLGRSFSFPYLIVGGVDYYERCKYGLFGQITIWLLCLDRRYITG